MGFGRIVEVDMNGAEGNFIEHKRDFGMFLAEGSMEVDSQGDISKGVVKVEIHQKRLIHVVASS